ncbi:hypothetical protein HYR54_07175 [Candidatus Acetothermia bacterium]|nr:hypothetical protein [Candidatus Acetothermia bacterium]
MTTKSAEEIYTKEVRRLPLKERLRLAALILDGVVNLSNRADIDEQTLWSEEDLRDLSVASLWYATQANDKE